MSERLSDGAQSWMNTLRERDQLRSDLAVAQRQLAECQVLLAEAVDHWHTSDEFCSHCVFCFAQSPDGFSYVNENDFDALPHREDCVGLRYRAIIAQAAAEKAT